MCLVFGFTMVALKTFSDVIRLYIRIASQNPSPGDNSQRQYHKHRILALSLSKMCHYATFIYENIKPIVITIEIANACPHENPLSSCFLEAQFCVLEAILILETPVAVSRIRESSNPLSLNVRRRCDLLAN
jgi:hypothetical protein